MSCLSSIKRVKKTMTIPFRRVVVAFCSLFFLAGYVSAQKTPIEADVKGVDGRPAKAAEVRIERQDKKMLPVIGRTDSHGHLAPINLDAGTYKLTATVQGGIQASQIVKTQGNKPLRVAFEMNKTAVVANKKTKNIAWGTPPTGTRIGRRYKDDDGSSADNVGNINGNALDTATRQTTSVPGRGAGGP
jgi:hypothetical protein